MKNEYESEKISLEYFYFKQNTYNNKCEIECRVI